MGKHIKESKDVSEEVVEGWSDGHEKIVSLGAQLVGALLAKFTILQDSIDELGKEIQRLKTKTKNLGTTSNGKNQQLDSIRADVCSLQAQMEQLKTESFKAVHGRLKVIEATIPAEVRDSIRKRLMKEQNSNYGEQNEHTH